MKENALELYRCAVLTVIAGLLAFLAWKIETNHVGVIVKSGLVNVETVEPLRVEGTVTVDQVDKPIEVEGTVYTHRLD